MKRALIEHFSDFFAGCHTDIVTTKQFKAVKNKCVYINTIDSDDPYVGKVIRDVLEKEFIRKRVRLCDTDSANVLNGSTFLTTRCVGQKRLASAAKNHPRRPSNQ